MLVGSLETYTQKQVDILISKNQARHNIMHACMIITYSVYT